MFFTSPRPSISAFFQAAQPSLPLSGKKAHLLRWLMSFGALGIFLVAIVDSSMIPMPVPGSTDLLLLLLAAQRGSSPLSAVWLAACALAGSLIGGYFTWSAGRKGGEVALERQVPQRFLNGLTDRVQRHGIWTVALAALLPPPIPLSPFLIAAGALKISRARFLLAFGSARLVRYGFLAWLGITYGRNIVGLWQHTLSGWGHVALWSYAGLIAAGIAFVVWKYRQSARKEAVRQPA